MDSWSHFDLGIQLGTQHVIWEEIQLTQGFVALNSNDLDMEMTSKF